MRKIKEIGTCFNCNISFTMFKTNKYKRFVKYEICGMSYALPKQGSISISTIKCPRSNIPILIVEKNQQKTYIWMYQPCFNCIKSEKCEIIKELIPGFKELEVYGY
ncbi:MAG: hypothetical protein ACFFA0_05155 [Promethearchaeota archaeon]